MAEKDVLKTFFESVNHNNHLLTDIQLDLKGAHEALTIEMDGAQYLDSGGSRVRLVAPLILKSADAIFAILEDTDGALGKVEKEALV